jgi:hypothetical protein
MKIRNGFVSNSSSTSFCIYGAKISGKDFEIDYDDEDNDDNEDDLDEYDSLEKIADEIGLEVYTMEYVDNFIGKSWASIGDDETGKQFKKSIEDKIKTRFPKAEFFTFEECSD